MLADRIGYPLLSNRRNMMRTLLRLWRWLNEPSPDYIGNMTNKEIDAL